MFWGFYDPTTKIYRGRKHGFFVDPTLWWEMSMRKQTNLKKHDICYILADKRSKSVLSVKERTIVRTEILTVVLLYSTGTLSTQEEYRK